VLTVEKSGYGIKQLFDVCRGVSRWVGPQVGTQSNALSEELSVAGDSLFVWPAHAGHGGRQSGGNETPVRMFL
jgi:hypothetical protein